MTPRWQWRRLAERIDPEPALPQSPVPDPHLGTGLVEPDSRSVPFFALNQLHCDIGWDGSMFRVGQKLHTHDCFAGTRFARDPNRAVIQHASTAVIESMHRSQFFALGVLTDQRGLNTL